MKNLIDFDIELIYKKKPSKDIVYYALDTENSNKNNTETITYCTSLAEVGVQKDKNNFEINDSNRINIFTHPIKFWNYIINNGYSKSDIFVFNADYDVENLFPYLFILYPQLKENTPSLKLTELDYYEKEGKVKVEAFTYEFIKSNNSIIGLMIYLHQINKGKTKPVYKTIRIYDLAKRTVGSLANNVKAYLGYEMSKEGLDYSIYRDFGHTEYSDLELKYIYEDTYYLKNLVYEFLFVHKFKKLTTGSNALENYKIDLFNDFVNNYNNTNHNIYEIYNNYFNSKKSKIKYYENHKNILKDYQIKELDNYYKFIENNGVENIDRYFLNMTNKSDLFNHLYPELNYIDFTYVFNAYKGGITRYNKPCKEGKWLGKEGFSFDINSSYPTSMKYKELPFGTGVKKSGRAIKKNGYVFIQRFVVDTFKIKAGYEPIIQLSKTRFKTDETWNKKYIGKVELTLTSIELEYFLKAYNYINLEYIDYIEFKSKIGLFDCFIDKNYLIKQTETGAKKEKAKLNLNSLYGKFGQNTVTEYRTTQYDNEMNCINDVIMKDKYDMNIQVKMTQVYLPVAVFTTAYSRLKLVNMLNNANKTKGVKWVYCDTDSIYLIGKKENCLRAMETELDKDNTGDLGLWKLEKHFIDINIIGIKKYICKIKKDNIIKYSVTLSGINKKYFDRIQEDLITNPNIINIIDNHDLKLINDNEYYIKKDTNNQLYPYVYKDKECTIPIIGAYKSLRKIKVKNGVILNDGVYCILGGKRR